MTSVGGSTPQFNILQPLGSLAYNYYQPLANVDVDIARELAWHLGYNYYQHGEKDFVGPTLPRYFHANNVTVSLKYAFYPRILLPRGGSGRPFFPRSHVRESLLTPVFSALSRTSTL